MQMFPRWWLWFCVLNCGAIGCAFLFAPDQAASILIDLPLDNDTTRTDIRATYGGMVLGLPLFFIWTGWKKNYQTGLLCAVLVFGGLAFGRMISITLGDQPGPLSWGFLLVEVTVAIVSSLITRNLSY